MGSIASELSSGGSWTRAEVLGLLKNSSGKGVRVGILDSGADSVHPAFSLCSLTNYEVETDEVVRVEKGIDYGDHGTACAGIMHMMAPDAEIHSVAVMKDARGDTTAKLIAGLRFAIESGWDIVNLSLGCRTWNDELFHLCEEATQSRILLIAAKDNRPGITGFPAAWDSAIGVDMEHFSNPGEIRYRPGEEIEVEASGIYVDAPSAGRGWYTWTGASFACPHVSGIAARFRQQFPELGLGQLRKLLAALSVSDEESLLA